MRQQQFWNERSKRGYSDHDKTGRNNTPRTCEERSTCIPFGVSAVKTFYPVCYDTEEKQSSVSEDNRSTLYWNPCVPITDNGEASFDFIPQIAIHPIQFSCKEFLRMGVLFL